MQSIPGMRLVAFSTLYLLWQVAAAPLQGPPAPGASVTYSIERPTKTDGARDGRIEPEQVAILELLNRADAAHLKQLDELVVPGSWHDDPMRYSPFPMTFDWATPYERLLLVDKRAQAFAAYEGGALVRWGPVSTGRQGMQTPSGLFHLTWRSLGRHSTVDPDWYMPWYFNFQNSRGLSFHQFALPGRPASHACVRLLERDAKWLFEWGESWTLDERGWTVLDPGTPVLIVGCYDFDEPPPWRSLASLAAGIHLPAWPATEPYSCR